MASEVVVYEHPDLPALTAQQVRARVNLVQQVMRGVMKPGTHYGKIPGAGEKPTLLKPGAETLAVTFRIAIDPVIEDLSSADEARYRVVCRGIHQDTGMLLGSGVGEASSNEEKYRWRRAVCEEEFDETPEDRRRVKWAKGKGGSTYQVKQVRTNHADVANTVLKMAKKRAQVDMTLSVTGASDLFTQDIEDLPREYWTAAARAPEPGVDAEALAELLALAARKGLSREQLERQLRAKGKLSGALEAIGESVHGEIMAALARMADKAAPPPPEPAAAPATEPEVLDAEEGADFWPAGEAAPAPPSEPEEEDIPGVGADEIDNVLPAAQAKATQRQLAKIAALLKETGADIPYVQAWMREQWGITSRSQLSKDQAGMLIEHLSSQPSTQGALDEGAA